MRIAAQRTPRSIQPGRLLSRSFCSKTTPGHFIKAETKGQAFDRQLSTAFDRQPLIASADNSHYAIRHSVRVEPDSPISRELRLDGQVPPRPTLE